MNKLSYAELLQRPKGTLEEEQAILNEALERLRGNKITLDQWRNLARARLEKYEDIAELSPASLEHNTPQIKILFLTALSNKCMSTPNKPGLGLFVNMGIRYKRQIASESLADQASKKLKEYKDAQIVCIDPIVRALAKCVLDYTLIGFPVGSIAGAFLNLPGVGDPSEVAKLKQEITSYLPEASIEPPKQIRRT